MELTLISGHPVFAEEKHPLVQNVFVVFRPGLEYLLRTLVEDN